MDNSIKLSHYTKEYIEALSTFQLPDEQLQFTALPRKYIEVTEGQHRVVILNNLVPVGFFLLHATERVKEYSSNSKAMLLTSFSINRVEQGKGYAKQAMLLLKDFVTTEFPNCNEIVLAVNHKNIAAQQLYLNIGFQDTGKRKMGPIGEQWIMSMKL
ncbi:GNAT family N-acetyltransferase [Ornithinibacillus sp. 179-J 7C1 HS]|uniref:GNAT family N-acetyltransferase n=1 Tax=Ornithinibacillus sp. 179-J 7C1 HS TaxID=3142384 RepID=UPI0039A2C33E